MAGDQLDRRKENATNAAIAMRSMTPTAVELPPRNGGVRELPRDERCLLVNPYGPHTHKVEGSVEKCGHRNVPANPHGGGAVGPVAPIDQSRTFEDLTDA